MKIYFWQQTLLIVFLTLAVSSVNGQSKVDKGLNYPNEPGKLRIYSNAKWRSILPWQSTQLDVETILGKPTPIRQEQFYITTLNDYMAGYDLDSDWVMMITYLGEGGIPQDLVGRVSHITLYPKHRIELVDSDLSSLSENYVLRDKGIEKRVYFDQFGLRYTVRVGDGAMLILESVRYGVSDEVEKKLNPSNGG